MQYPLEQTEKNSKSSISNFDTFDEEFNELNLEMQKKQSNNLYVGEFCKTRIGDQYLEETEKYENTRLHVQRFLKKKKKEDMALDIDIVFNSLNDIDNADNYDTTENKKPSSILKNNNTEHEDNCESGIINDKNAIKRKKVLYDGLLNDDSADSSGKRNNLYIEEYIFDYKQNFNIQDTVKSKIANDFFEELKLKEELKPSIKKIEIERTNNAISERKNDSLNQSFNDSEDSFNITSIIENNFKKFISSYPTKVNEKLRHSEDDLEIDDKFHSLDKDIKNFKVADSVKNEVKDIKIDNDNNSLNSISINNIQKLDLANNEKDNNKDLFQSLIKNINEDTCEVENKPIKTQEEIEKEIQDYNENIKKNIYNRNENFEVIKVEKIDRNVKVNYKLKNKILDNYDVGNDFATYNKEESKKLKSTLTLNKDKNKFKHNQSTKSSSYKNVAVTKSENKDMLELKKKKQANKSKKNISDNIDERSKETTKNSYKNKKLNMNTNIHDMKPVNINKMNNILLSDNNTQLLNNNFTNNSSGVLPDRNSNDQIQYSQNQYYIVKDSTKMSNPSLIFPNNICTDNTRILNNNANINYNYNCIYPNFLPNQIQNSFNPNLQYVNYQQNYNTINNVNSNPHVQYLNSIPVNNIQIMNNHLVYSQNIQNMSINPTHTSYNSSYFPMNQVNKPVYYNNSNFQNVNSNTTNTINSNFQGNNYIRNSNNMSTNNYCYSINTNNNTSFNNNFNAKK